MAIDRDPALRWVIQAAEQIHNRAFATTTGSHQGHRLPPGHLQIQPLNHLLLAIAKAHTLSLQSAGETGEFNGFIGLGRVWLYIQNLVEIVGRSGPLLPGGI